MRAEQPPPRPKPNSGGEPLDAILRGLAAARDAGPWAEWANLLLRGGLPLAPEK